MRGDGPRSALWSSPSNRPVADFSPESLRRWRGSALLRMARPSPPQSRSRRRAKLVFLARRRFFCTLLVDEFPKYTLDEDLARLAFADRNAIELR